MRSHGGYDYSTWPNQPALSRIRPEPGLARDHPAGHRPAGVDPSAGFYRGSRRDAGNLNGCAILKYFYKWGRSGALKLDRRETTRAVRAVAAARMPVSGPTAEFEQVPLTLLQGDSHLGIISSQPDGTADLLDWLVVWRGPGLRQVTYWMVTGLVLEPEMRREHERDLLERYLQDLRTGVVSKVPSILIERHPEARRTTPAEARVPRRRQ